MSVQIFPAFDAARINGGLVFQIQEQTGASATFTYTSGVYSHARCNVANSDVYDTGTIKFPARQTASTIGDTIVGKLLADANASTALAGTYTLTSFAAATTGLLTIGVSGAGTGWRLGASSNTMGRRVLGMDTAGSYSTAKVSDRGVWFWFAGAQGGISNVSDDYEAGDVAIDAETDDGYGTGIAWTSPPRYFDFTLPMEPYSKTQRRAAATATPFTLQHLWEHARNIEHMLVATSPTYSINENHNRVITASSLAVCQLRASGASWRPERVAPDWDELWNATFETRLLGRWPQ